MSSVPTDHHFAPLLKQIKALRTAKKGPATANTEDIEGEIVAVHELPAGDKLLAIQLWGGFALARVNASLDLDPGFGQGGFIEDVFDDSDWGYSAAYGLLISDDSLLLTGEYFDFLEFRSKAALAKYTLEGKADEHFGQSGKLVLELPESQPTNVRGLLKRSGQLFNKMAQPSPGGHVALDDDKIVMVLLEATYDNSDGITQLIRLNADGSFDTTFNGTGVVHVSIRERELNPGGVQVLADGRLLVYGGTQPTAEGGYALIARYTVDGQLDDSFNVDGSPGFIAIGEEYQRARFGALLMDEQGDIFAVGDLNGDVLMAHLKQDGRPAPEFNGGLPLRFAVPQVPLDRWYAAQWQDTRLVIAGTAFQAGERRGLLMRLTRGGALDGSFAGGQGFSVAGLYSEYFDAVVEADGTIVTAGFFADPDERAWLKRHGVNGENAVQPDLAVNTSASTWLRATPARNKRLE